MADEQVTNKERGGDQGVKVPKGTRDINPYQAAVREEVISKVTQIFKRHGAVTIETPVFELKDTLTGKYGEDSKLIYDLADQGGELCSLRYDLTVPFARHIAMNKLEKMKRYHIAKVYRRDNPAMTKGRFREFYQCDCDIAGVYDSMIPDAECCKMMVEILDALEVGSYCIKVNHRKLLDAIFEICEVPSHMFRPICSAVDKLDKEPWESVRKEMVEIKGLPGASADRIWEFVRIKGDPWTVIKQLSASKAITENATAQIAVSEMTTLFEFLDIYQVTKQISFDLSLARGLDYYTGLIYEAVLTGTDQVGSIAGGGRYDDLVGMYGKKQVPCVGFSIGIERLFTILEENARKKNLIRESPTDVVVVSIGKGMLAHRMTLLNELWAAGINAEQLCKRDPKPQHQLTFANDHNIPLACIIGEDELKAGLVQVKHLTLGQQQSVPRSQLVAYLKSHTSTKSSPSTIANTASSSGVPEGFASLQAFEDHMASRSFVEGYVCGPKDVAAFNAIGRDPSTLLPHTSRFYRTIAALSNNERSRFTQS
eukprot:c9697_g1_i2.p1 GENE.c9697_g1_i2~~c9697_g1_i2.p1  ORF type:complete len:550 (+),score=144.43 c9697_g1_i2:33-1652(+)